MSTIALKKINLWNVGHPIFMMFDFFFSKKCLCMQRSMCIQESAFEDTVGVKATKELNSRGDTSTVRGISLELTSTF